MTAPARPKTKSPWRTLYAMIWLVFLQIIVALFEFPGSVYLHVAIGFVIVGIAHYHQAHIKRMAVPDRIRRIVRSTAQLASAQFFLGIYTFLALELQWSLPIPQVIVLLHLVVALAIFSQASSTATAYAMWEAREFEKVAEVPG